MPRIATIESTVKPSATAAAFSPFTTAGTTAGTTANGGAPADQGIHEGQDGTVTIDPPGNHQDEQKTAATLAQTNRWLVIPITHPSFAEAMRRLAIGFADSAQRAAMVTAYGEVTDLVAEKAGAAPTGTGSAGTAPQYKDLPEAATAAATTVEEFPIETNNSHADAEELKEGGETLTVLLKLDLILEQAATVVGLAAAPLARQLAGTVSDVCASVQKELPRNPALQRTLGPALSYTADRVALGQSTKKKIKKAKAQAASGGGQKPGDQGTPPPASTGDQGGGKSNMK